MLLWSGALLVAKVGGCGIHYILSIKQHRALSKELGGSGGVHGAAKIQDQGDFLGFYLLSLRGQERIQIQVGGEMFVGKGGHQAGEAVNSRKWLPYYSQVPLLLGTFCTMCTADLVQIPKPFFIIVPNLFSE